MTTARAGDNPAGRLLRVDALREEPRGKTLLQANHLGALAHRLFDHSCRTVEILIPLHGSFHLDEGSSQGSPFHPLRMINSHLGMVFGRPADQTAQRISLTIFQER